MLDDQTVIVVVGVLVVLQVAVPGIDFIAMAENWLMNELVNQYQFW